jgi:zinc protease
MMRAPFRLSTLVAGIIILVVSAVPGLAVEIKQVKSPGGITALLVEDYTVPIVTVSFSFRGGAAQDPSGREGMADLISTLFDEGAGPYDSKAFQARLEQFGVRLRISEGLDRFTGTMRVLKDDAATGFEMLRLALTELNFEQSAIDRMRAALISNITAEANDAQVRAARAMRESLFADHPYSRSSDGTIEGLNAITRDEIVDHFGRLFARDNLTVGIVGAISVPEAEAMLDKVFSGLPEKSALAAIPEAQITFGKRIEVDDTGSQTMLALAFPGVKRDSPEFFAAYLMNHILGGGSFSSRLYDEVREKRGLSYSVGSSMSSFDRAAYITASSSTLAERADETLAILQSEIARMAAEGPSEAELVAAKKYVIGSYAINNLDTSADIASVLVTIQTEQLGTDYLDRRAGIIDAVTIEDVRAAARRLLAVEPTIVVVGPAKS